MKRLQSQCHDLEMVVIGFIVSSRVRYILYYRGVMVGLIERNLSESVVHHQ
jgi:hypothetical protein